MKKVYLMAVTLLLSLFAAVSPAYGATAADSVTVTLTWKLVNQTGDVDVIKKFVIGNESGFTTLLAKDLKGTSATVKVPKGVYTMFMLKQFFSSLPGELEDAGKIDGCSWFRL